MTKEIEIICGVLDSNPDYRQVENEVIKSFEEAGLTNMQTSELQQGMNIVFDFSHRKDIHGKILTVIESGKAFMVEAKGYHSPILLAADELQNIRRG